MVTTEIKGKIKEIVSVSPIMEKRVNGALGPGGYIEKIFQGMQTTFKTEGISEQSPSGTYRFDGIILSDSIGNNISMTYDKKRKSVTEITDLVLERKYNSIHFT